MVRCSEWSSKYGQQWMSKCTKWTRCSHWPRRDRLKLATRSLCGCALADWTPGCLSMPQRPWVWCLSLMTWNQLVGEEGVIAGCITDILLICQLHLLNLFDALIITSCPKESSCAIQKWCFSWRCRKVASRLYHWLLVAFLIYGIVKLAIELSICSGEDQAVKLVVAVLTNLWSCCLMQRVFVEAFCGRSSNVSGSCKIGLLARLCKEWTQMDVWWTNQTACIENLRRGRFNTIKQLHTIVQNHFVCWQISDWLCAVNPVWRTRLALHTGRPWQWICYCWWAQWWSCAAGVASWITRLLGCSQLSRKSGWIES